MVRNISNTQSTLNIEHLPMVFILWNLILKTVL